MPVRRMMEESIRKADILIEALPYIQAFRGKVVVAKYGGSAIENPAAIRGILQDLVFLSTVGIQPVLVHGGGPAITKRLAAQGRGTSFVDGMRVTDQATVEIVEGSLAELNRALAEQIRALGGRAEGLGAPQQVVVAAPHPKAAQLGFVGQVRAVRTAPIREVFTAHAIPVISPIGVADGQLYNINADDVAAAVAAHLEAEKLVLLTNVRGILRNPADLASLISTLPVGQAGGLLARGVIQEGMIPKVQACIGALVQGVRKTHIIDAALPHAMLLEIFTKQGIGTEIVP
ncbi:MAG TPA: acetylglutamate kinase [bacterium]